MLKNTVFKQLPIFFILLPVFFLLFAIVWHLSVNETLYHCIDNFPIGDFLPPFVHEESSLGQDYFIASPVIVYSLWFAFLVGILTMPLVIIRLARSKAVSLKAGVIFIALLFFFFLIFFVRVPSFVSRANTEYTKSFSTAKFNSVKIGMTEEQVLAILGEPLYRYTDDRIQLSYSGTKNSLSDFTGWESIRIILNNEHIVIEVGSNIFFN